MDKNLIAKNAIIELQLTVSEAFDNFQTQLEGAGLNSSQITSSYISASATLIRNLSALYGAFSAITVGKDECDERFKSIFKQSFADMMRSFSIAEKDIRSMRSVKDFRLPEEELDRILEEMKDFINE